MALSLGGIMRGALPVATQYLTETPDANAQLINAVGEKFDNIGREINPKIEAAQANIDTIEDIANTYGVSTDVVAGLFSTTGGKRKETIQQLKNSLGDLGETLGKSLAEFLQPFVDSLKTLSSIAENIGIDSIETSAK